ncbi:hypothetical protein [Nannocystis punicea]|uniref:SH3 domain-containing protein n=1 Tax=Nannocystis punicea TaxID=2995304 RepID=A0ABY7GSU9_9BACT|nr:hypothetical protein [Nannocystis poenicansa]WAS90030.1 hypothetical protein O0S08_27870 [Nannocystis poenicansa]
MLARFSPLLLLLGCAAAQPPELLAPATTPSAASAVPAETPPAPAAPPPVEAASPPATATPPPSTCELHHSNWDSPTARTLRSASGRSFGAIRSADELRFVADGEATAEFTSFGLRLRTTPTPGDLPVYTRGELVFGGVLQAGNTPLVWTPIGGPRLRVAPPTDRRVRFVDDPSVDVACDALALEESYSDLAVPDRRLRPRGPVAVAATPGGPPVLHLHLKRAARVKWLADAGSQVKIAWPIADGALVESTVSGWVEARLVEPLNNWIAGEFPPGSFSLQGTTHWGGCSAEHPLYVDTGRGAEPVGEILAGTRVRTGPRRGELVVVEVEGPAVRESPPPLRLRPEARFLLAPADAADCSG